MVRYLFVILLFFTFNCNGQNKVFNSLSIDSILNGDKIVIIPIFLNDNGLELQNFDTKTLADRILNYLSNSDLGLKQRSVISFPVPTLRPKNQNIIAFDVMPNGNPIPNSNGVAWLDVCDVDCINSEPPINVVRLGAKANSLQIGSRIFNNATLKPLEFIHNLDIVFSFEDGVLKITEETILPPVKKGGICFVNGIFYKSTDGISWIQF